MSRPLRKPTGSRWIILLLIAMLSIAALPTAAQSDPTGDPGVIPVTIAVSMAEVVDTGRTWTDEEGFHARDLVVALSVDGDLAGTGELVADLDWFGQCDPEDLVCDGDLDIFADATITSEEATWSGPLAIEVAQGARSAAHGILIGRHGTGDQVIVLDALTVLDEANTLQISGRMVTLDGPIGGVHLTHSACITGPATADGGFIGTRGLVLDNGPARVVREAVGGAEPTGIYGEVRQLGHKGNLRGIFAATMNGNHAYGSFVLAGETGAYSGMLGYGRAMATVTEEPRCQSGLQVTSTWTGQVRYFIDPASFLAPRVYFDWPPDNAVVGTPVTFELAAENVEIEPAGEAREGAGYFTVIVDAPCVAPGEPVPDDDQHFHLRNGETVLELSLFTGLHRLCLQLTDGAGFALPANDVITIRVTSSGGEGPGGV